jgi:sugar phosphate isomerase/epimerase
MDLICASICYRGYAEDEVQATLEHAPRIGYHWLEVHGPLTWSLEAIQQFDLPALQARIRLSGMECAGLYTPGWGGSDDGDVLAHAAAISRCAGFARELGLAPVLGLAPARGLAPGFGAPHVTSTGAERRGSRGALERVIRCAQAVVQSLPEENPVLLALEPHFGNVLEQPEDFSAVLSACPDERLGVCVDTGHFHSAGVDIPAFIRQFAGRIYSVHLKDHIGSRSVGIGRGEIDLPGILAALQASGYQAGLTVELEVDDPQNLARYTEEAFFYLKGLLGEKLG